MQAIIEGPPGTGEDPPRSWPRRLAWFFGLAAASGLAVALAAYALKALLPTG